MKYLKSYKLFEEAATKPVKKFPTDKAVHWNYLAGILRSAGIDMYKDLKRGPKGGPVRGTDFQDFCFAKCSSKDNVVFPNKKDSEGWDDRRYDKFIFGESVFLLPESYDSSNDSEDAKKERENFLNKMREYAKAIYDTKEEQDEFVKNAEEHVEFGPGEYDWANPALKVIHDELGQYYKDGKLRVWFPKDRDYDPWEGYDYPHRYNVVGDLDRPNGVYYLSDIEKYIDHKYGIKDELFYDFIIHNEYIEGRYWERVWSLRTDENDGSKLQKTDFGEYGMEPTENITHILNIIEKDFGDEIQSTDYEGFPIYIDYYKEVRNY